MKEALKFAIGCAAILLLAAAIIGVLSEDKNARAQNVGIAGVHLVPVGFQQIASVTSGAAVTLTVPTGANNACFQVDTAPLRWRDDGTAPTASIGMQVANSASGCTFFYTGTLTAIQFIAVSTTGTLNITYYRGP